MTLLVKPSLREYLHSIPLSQRIALIQSLSPEEQVALLYDWELQARPDQIEPADWVIWLIMTGRGWGKTLTGAETTRRHKEQGTVGGHIALVAPTAADARDVMLGLTPGSSGLLQVCPPWDMPLYEPSKRRAVWPDGTVATLYSAEEPDRLRGPQHGFAWGDEPATWPDGEAVLSNLFLGLRIGEAKSVFTTTPRTTEFVKSLTRLPGVQITRGSMFDNPFLNEGAKERLRARYEGTRLGRQELYGELLEDNPDALWTESMIAADRSTLEKFSESLQSQHIQIKRTAIAIDPAVTANKNSNETGIVAGCIDSQNPPHAYILHDATMSARPEVWARKVSGLSREIGADRVIGEVNNGGDLIRSTLQLVDPSLPYKEVRATKGKILRAEPISALYEQHRVHHVGTFPRLESQMCDYDGSQASPDRLDALVWLLTFLLLGKTVGRLLTW